MASRKRTLEIEFLIDDKDVKRGNRELEASVTKTGKAFSGLGTAVKGAVAAFGVREIGQFAFEAAQMASSAEQAGKSAEKVLGPALETIHDNLEDVRGVMGLNIGELDEIIARYGLLSEGFGQTNEEQAKFLEFLILTGGELAAFKGNIEEAPEAIDAIGAALRGEFDPLEQFGVKLKQSEINERALELQAADTTGELTEQEAQIAALEELIREKAGPALGSLAEAQETLGGKTNEATTRFEDLKIELGQRLLPHINDVMDSFIDVMDVLDDTKKADTFSERQFAELQDMANAASDVWEWFGRLIDRTDDLSGQRVKGGGVRRDIEEIGEAAAGAQEEVVTLREEILALHGIEVSAPPIGKYGFGVNVTAPPRNRDRNFHTGGVVPGVPGEDVPIMAQAGEEVTRRADAHGTEPTTVNNIFYTSPTPTDIAVLNELRRRSQG